MLGRRRRPASTTSLHGSDITINDPTAPSATVEASGLLAGGARSGSDPVTVTASDNSGIQRVELIDVTNRDAPVFVGVEDYSEGRTDANRVCDYTLPAPVPEPQPRDDPGHGLPAGQRLAARARLRHRRQHHRPRSVPRAASRRRRTAARSTAPDATDTGTLDVSWAVGGKRGRTLDYGDRAGIRGRLLNSAGAPIARRASVTLLTRDLRRGAPLVPRTTLTTAADGSFRTTVIATASRLLQFGWLSHANDVRFAANGVSHPPGARRRAAERLHPAPAGRPQLHDQRQAAAASRAAA